MCQVVGLVTGALQNWNEYMDEGLLTTGAQDIFYVQKFKRCEGHVMSLIKTKIGIRAANDERDVLLGSGLFRVKNIPYIVSLSRNGALHQMCVMKDSDDCISLVSDPTNGYICPHCNTKLLRDISCAKEHITKMHYGPIFCRK